MRNPEIAPRTETMVETITFVGICREVESFQGFLGGAGFRPSTVGPLQLGALLPCLFLVGRVPLLK